ncbi:hypothetical protein FNF27_07320 [Cafeteria roenbergensis]|uniref:Vacuolar protein sorting-associated protein 52 homolog n=2 Tax=Cafeteria roenbergensis TaxID=33653 RepID=A0A5A8DU27_CAFRO|nr:hypothetical protein FNF27_07320 [Cafeteria roenbergensis]
MSDEEDAARMALFGSRASRPAPPKAGNPFAEDGPAKKPPRKAESGAGAAASPAAASGGDDEEEALRSDLFRGTSGEAGILARRRQEAERGDDGSDGPGSQHEGDAQDIGDDVEIDLDFDHLDETTTEVDLATIDEDLARFRKHPFVGEALSRGVDLASYADTLSRQLREVEMASVADYVSEAPAFAQLYREMTESEGALGRLQTLLLGFQRNLEGIGAEISQLKRETSTKKHGLANRSAVGARLQAFLAKVAVSPEMISSICDGPVDDGFVDDVRALSDKLAFAARQGRAARGSGVSGSGGDESGSAESSDGLLSGLGIDPFETAAGRDALPQLEGLRLRAVSRCRTHLLQSFEELRRPRSNPQAFQAHVLLRQRALMTFLLTHAREVGREVVAAYVVLWSKSLHALVKSYHAGLMRSCAPVATAADLVVPDTSAAAAAAAGAAGGRGGGGGGGFFARFSSAGTGLGAGRRRPDDARALAVRGRAAVLRRASDPPEPVHEVESSGRLLAYEEVFRASQRHVVQLAATEHAFCLAFFGRSVGPDAYTGVMAAPVSAALECFSEQVGRSHDAVGLLLMINLTALHRSAAVEGITGTGPPRSAHGDADDASVSTENGAAAAGAAAAESDAGSAAAVPAAKAASSSEGAAATDAERKPSASDARPAGGGSAAAADDADAEARADAAAERAAQARRDRGESSAADARPPPPRGALPVMEGYFDRVTMCLWPRLKASLDAHAGSLRRADAARLGAVSVAPHFAAVRYAELAASVLGLHRGLRRLGGFGDDMLRHNMALMRSELDALLGRLAARHPAREVRVAFLHNTYRRCAALLAERRAPEDEVAHFADAAAAQAELFAAEAVTAHFARMVALVNRCEADMVQAAAAAGQLPEGVSGSDLAELLDAVPRGSSGELRLPASIKPRLDAAEAEALVRDFSGAWSGALGGLNDAVQRLVGSVDASGALEVLKKTAFRMLSLYARLLDIVKRVFPGTPAFMREAVSVPSILREIQRYARAGQEAAQSAAGGGDPASGSADDAAGAASAGPSTA